MIDRADLDRVIYDSTAAPDAAEFFESQGVDVDDLRAWAFSFNLPGCAVYGLPDAALAGFDVGFRAALLQQERAFGL